MAVHPGRPEEPPSDSRPDPDDPIHIVPPTEERIPADDHWPATQHSVIRDLEGQGEPGRRELRVDLMRTYRPSLLEFYVKCAGDARFPRVENRERAGILEEAEEVVDFYFAKRIENLIPKWKSYRREHPREPARYLRVFIRQDFRFHCLEEFRRQRRDHRAESLPDGDALGCDADPPDVVIDRESRRRFAEKELGPIVQAAIEETIDTFDRELHQDLCILARERLLLERPFDEFADRLTCNRTAARQRLHRFRKRFARILREHLELHGGGALGYLEDLS